ncbi:MAG TPA: hypothetical protein VIZ64_00715, partial [Dokdonella sp.]
MRERLADLLHALVVVAIAAAIAFLSTRHGVERDWSHARSASLGEASLAVLDALDGPGRRAADQRQDQRAGNDHDRREREQARP